MSALLRQIQAGRMTHALLISGDSGVGKWTLAKGLAAKLLCEAPSAEHRPCGQCRACEQMENLAHPDLTVLELGAPLRPTETKTAIPVTDVEEMIGRISLQGYQGDQHVVLIHQAEHMNVPAQNKLLKTLEEPPEGTFFLLTCENTEKLLPTIVSRCRPLKLHPWPEDQVLQVLEDQGYTGDRAREAAREAGGSFGRALTIMGDEAYWTFRTEVMHDFLAIQRRSDIIAVSTRWKDRKDQSDALFSVLENLFSRLARVSLGILPEENSISDCPQPWISFSKRAGAADYSRLLEAVALARRRAGSSVSFQIVIEQLILTLMEALNI